MKGDFSRDTFDVAKHFSRVLQQQGRVQLDADGNEQTAILLHYIRTLAADLIGPFAGPAGDKAFGFKIEQPTEDDGTWDFKIGNGRYYVDGILCENDESKDVTYLTQQDFPNPPDLPNPNETKYLVYLDVWERHITALEDDAIREKALGGPDTATRAQVVWQVKIESKAPDNETLGVDCRQPEKWSKWIELWQPNYLGCLRARVKPSIDTKDPCLTAPDAKYRGPENQLYRVEIHQGGQAGTATFKWSRDNGAIVTACELSGTELTVHNPRGFAVGQWAELITDEQELRSEPGTMVKIIKIEGDVLSLDSEDLKKLPPQIPPTKVRRWDHHEAKGIELADGGVKIVELTFVEYKNLDNADWTPLEDGVEIQFLKPSNNGETQYRTGDYWLIPARVATGDIEWPNVKEEGNLFPAPKPPNGIRHHYAPLAILTNNSSNWIVNFGDDLRCKFHPLNNTCGLSYSYGEEGIGGHLLCIPPIVAK